MDCCSTHTYTHANSMNTRHYPHIYLPVRRSLCERASSVLIYGIMAGHVVTNDPKNLCQTPAASAPASAYAFCAVPASAARWDDDEHQPASQPPPGNSFSTAKSCLPILNARNIDSWCWSCFPRSPRFLSRFSCWCCWCFAAAANQSAFEMRRDASVYAHFIRPSAQSCKHLILGRGGCIPY